MTPALETMLPLITAIGTASAIGGLSHATNGEPAFTFAAASAWAPSTPAIRGVYYQLDNTRGPWLLATGSGPFAAKFTGLRAGEHVLFAYAVDSLEGGATAGSSGIGSGNSPIVGSIAAYPFTVVAPSPTAVQSRKRHAGVDRDLAITPGIPIGGAVNVEPRAMGPGHQIIFQFAAPVLQAGSATALDSASAPTGVASAAINPNNRYEVVVKLAGIADNQRVKLTLDNVNGIPNSYAVSLGFLVGDVNGSGAVNASDISGVKAQLTQPAGAANFKLDVNATGTVNAAGLTAVKARSGLVLAP
jgi:hypothetical protein